LRRFSDTANYRVISATRMYRSLVLYDTEMYGKYPVRGPDRMLTRAPLETSLRPVQSSALNCRAPKGQVIYTSAIALGRDRLDTIFGGKEERSLDERTTPDEEATNAQNAKPTTSWCRNSNGGDRPKLLIGSLDDSKHLPLPKMRVSIPHVPLLLVRSWSSLIYPQLGILLLGPEPFHARLPRYIFTCRERESRNKGSG
jgi:hypothetical protein